MGQGMAEVGSRIADITMRGQQAMAQGIASGVKSIADAYAEHKQMTADVAAKEKAISTFLPYLPEDKRTAFENKISQIQSNTGMSLREKKAFYETAFGMLGQSVGHQMSMEKIAAETKGRLAGAGISAAPEYARIELEKKKLESAEKASAAAAEQRAKAVSAFGEVLSGKPSTSTPQPQSVSGALPEKTGTELTDSTAFDNLDIPTRLKIQNSKINPGIWDSYDAKHRASLLDDPNNIIWNK